MKLLITSRNGRLGLAVAALTAQPLVAALAQSAPTTADRTAADSLERIVITAQRMPVPLAASSGAVEILPREELAQLPLWNVADALEHVPGFALIDADGLGNQPRLVARGFYGGGETDYVSVLLDGVPLSGVAAGLVNWDVLPLAALERVEVLRGGASALYGDAAVGGVVNLITRTDGSPGLDWSLSGGSHDLLHGALNARGELWDRDASAFAAARRASGYRAHAGHRAGSVGASLALQERDDAATRVSTLHHWREYEEPGPLPAELAAAARRASLPFYRFDATRERLHRLAIDATRALAQDVEAAGYIAGEYARSEATRTLPLTPEFADTQQREWRTRRVLASAQLQLTALPLAWSSRLLMGGDLSYAELDSSYRPVVLGDALAYERASGAPGPVRSRSDTERAAAAAFAAWELQPTQAVRLVLGSRFDWLRDRFATGAVAAEPARSSTHTAFSPRLGINFRYSDGPQQSGNLYLTAGRTFKAPTLDQLFDQRAIPLPVAPFAASLSNEALEPQRGTLLEAGLYHRRALPAGVHGELSLALYQQEMREEIDFDLQSLQYVNIGRSRHRGVETRLELAAPAGWRAFAGFTYQAAQSRRGLNRGLYLKAIPRRVAHAGVVARLAPGLTATLTATDVRDIPLDDANTLHLPGFTRTDLRLSYALGEVELMLDVRNLFDREYSTTGFPDPAGSGLLYLHPAAGRVVRIGVSAGH